MTNDPSSSASSELALQLIAILGLPERIEKLSLHFVANQPVVADVRYCPNVANPLAIDARFKCVPVDRPELAQALENTAQQATENVASQGVPCQ